MNKKRTLFCSAVLAAAFLAVSLWGYHLWGIQWPVGTAVYFAVNANTGQTSGEGGAVRSAASSWSDIYPSGLRFSYTGTTSGTADGLDGENLVCWKNEGDSGALATTYAWYSGSTIIETDVIFNDFYNWSVSGADYDVETVALHEFGHCVGLDHSASGIMQPYYSGIQRSIDGDARAGFMEMYGGTEDLPVIELDRSSLSFFSSGEKTFRVRNSGEDILEYVVSADAVWMSLSPTSGSSGGEWDAITVTVESVNLSPGDYEGEIRVGSSEAGNSPQFLNVYLYVEEDQPPSVSFVSPKNNDQVSLETKIDVQAVDDYGVDKVLFFIDGKQVHTDRSYPYLYFWDTTKTSNGHHSLRVQAFDTSGQTGETGISVVVKNFRLTLNADTGGTTDPAPGVSVFGGGTEVSIKAVPDQHYRFLEWSGDAEGGVNPITVVMDSDKNITAHFLRIIYPPLNFSGEKTANRSLLQEEYINVLSWDPNPDNGVLDITAYRIYVEEDNAFRLLTEAEPSVCDFRHRGVEKDKTTVYVLTAVIAGGREGDPAETEVR